MDTTRWAFRERGAILKGPCSVVTEIRAQSVLPPHFETFHARRALICRPNSFASRMRAPNVNNPRFSQLRYFCGLRISSLVSPIPAVFT